MTRRLPSAAKSRGTPVELTVAGTTVRGFVGESVAAAALASGVATLSRSLKYHRPRSAFCMEGHCGGCLMRIGGVPNLRACQTPCESGLVAEAQNAFPSAEHDVLGAVDLVFFGGMDHHTLMTSSAALNAVARRVVRQLSGLGTLPQAARAEAPPVQEHQVDVAILGGGAAGLRAARETAAAGLSTLVIDDQLELGGSLRADPALGPPAAEEAATRARDAGAALLGRTTAIGYFPEDAGGVLVAASDAAAHRVHARAWIWASGGYATNLPLGDNDRPGVLALRAGLRLLLDEQILVGEAIAIVADARLASEAAAAASAFTAAGAAVTVLAADEVRGVVGRRAARGLTLADGRRLDCDAVLVAAVPSCASEGPRQHGCKVALSAAAGGFALVVDALGQTDVPGVWGAGDVCGYVGPARAAEHGAAVGAACAKSLRSATAAKGAR